MRTSTFNPLATLIVPVVVPLSLAVLVLQRSWVPAPLETWLAVLPSLLFAAVLVLAVRFNLSRLALAALALALADLALRATPPDSEHRVVYDLVALLVPLNLGWLAWTSERGLRGGRGLLKTGLVLTQAGLVWWLAQADAATVASWLPTPLPWAVPSWAEPLSGTAWLAYLLALAVLTGRFVQRRSVLDGGFLGLLAASFLTVTQPIGSASFNVYAAAGGLVLLVSLVEVSYALAYHDELTGLPGRRALNDALKRMPRRYTVAMIDIDHFKRFNDRFGHDAGDHALRKVASHLSRITGRGRAFRYGGEEFTILFRGKDANQAQPHLEAVRKAVASTPFTVRGRGRPRRRTRRGTKRATRARRARVTVSVGAASRDGRRIGAEAVVKAADKLLYRAKKRGRNRVEL